jgi:FtsH-binding integral membrane protein
MWLLGAFTFLESLTVASVCAHYEQHGVGQLVAVAWGITLSIFVFLTAYVFVSKKDFSFLGMYLPAALLGFLVFSLVSLIFGFQMGWLYAFIGALLFSAFIVYDTYMIMNRMGCDDYIIAAIELYLDIINLFLMILQLLGRDR